MKLKPFLTFVVLLSAAFFALAPTASAQITPGTYQLIGSLRNGVGFDGVVTIDETQAAGAKRVDVRLTNGYWLRGWVENGNFKVEQVRRGRTRIGASGTIFMRGADHAIGNIIVRGQGRGVMMLGRSE